MKEVFGRADHRRPEGGRRGYSGDGAVPKAHHVERDQLRAWKAKFGGLEVSDAKRLLADTKLNSARLKDLLSNSLLSEKKW